MDADEAFEKLVPVMEPKSEPFVESKPVLVVPGYISEDRLEKFLRHDVELNIPMLGGKVTIDCSLECGRVNLDTGDAVQLRLHTVQLHSIENHYFWWDGQYPLEQLMDYAPLPSERRGFPLTALKDEHYSYVMSRVQAAFKNREFTAQLK